MAKSSFTSGILTHPAGWIATGFGVGFAPYAAGTCGSLVALIPWWFGLRHLSWPYYLGTIVLAFAIGVWAANWVIAKTKITDPSLVVWDEFIGQWIALAFVPAGWPWLVAGFVLFRLFDIAKPWPVSWADQKVHGGFGVMLDDVLAGLYALGSLKALVWALH